MQWFPWFWWLHVSPEVGLAAPRNWPGESFWPLVVLLALYFIGIGPLRKRLSPGARFPTTSALLFTCGVLVLYFALENYYLDVVGERYLFCLHMLQHCLLIFVVPPLMMPGTPGWLVRPFTRLLGVRPVLRVLTQAIVAGLLFNIIFNVWHLDGLFEWALRDRTVHLAEHLSFLFGAVLMWWPILSPLPEFPRLGSGGQIVYFFFLSLSQVPLFFFLAFSNHVYYDTYIHAPRIWDLTPLQDQQVGGILMKIVGEIAFLTGIGLAFARWYRTERVRVRPQQPSLN